MVAAGRSAVAPGGSIVAWVVFCCGGIHCCWGGSIVAEVGSIKCHTNYLVAQNYTWSCIL